MSLKDLWNSFVGKKEELAVTEQPEEEQAVSELPVRASDLFPVVRVSDEQLSSYKKVPIAGLAALGAAFSQFPEGARTIVQSVTQTIATGETLFVGINPKGIDGFLRANANGTVGNIMQINEQGKQIIAGRMRFKPVDGLPVNETTLTTLPIDPTLMVVAIALMTIEKKLDGIQKGIDEILQFLKLEKQSKLRGNLNMLSEIMEDCKQNYKNEAFCTSRLNEVLSIKTAAHQDILFYQEQIASELQKCGNFHGAGDSQKLLDSVSYQFAEYQLACYIYAFSTFLDIVLQKGFDAAIIESATNKMVDLTKRYTALYGETHGKLSAYQHSAFEVQFMGGLGALVKGLGEVISAVPILKDGPVDEALIGAGESIGKSNEEALEKQLKAFETFETTRMTPFIDNLQTVHLLYNEENTLITDGVDLYMREPA